MSSSLQLVGKIKSVVCEDFVTYDKCSFYPSEYLNVIIGPNGTGKSTLVAAIVLGLGGNPKLLSRATSVQDYVKNGKRKASITVEIYVDKLRKTQLFRRGFDVTGKSEYKINAESVNSKKYLEAVSNFNIQINNLCQFLPQDRVQDFAKMNPQEIFTNTISSICSRDINHNFEKLKELSKTKSTLTKRLPSDRQKLQESITRKQDLQKILERTNIRKQLIEDLHICKAKEMWSYCDKMTQETKEIDRRYQYASRNLKELRCKYDNMIKIQFKYLDQRNEYLKNVSEQKNKVFDAISNFDKASEDIENLEQHIRKATFDFGIKKRDYYEICRDGKNEVRILEALLQDVKNASAIYQAENRQDNENENTNNIFLSLKVEIEQLSSKRMHINKQLEDEFIPKTEMIKNRVKRLENVFEQKLQLLRKHYKDVYMAVLWLRENKHIFKGRVYEPTILELSVPDPNHAKYFESTIPLKDLLAFTVQDKTDMSKFIDHLCIENKLDVHVLYSQPTTDFKYVPSEPITNFRQFGFFAYLINLIEGPPPILNSLCSLYHMERILVGTEKVNERADELPSNIRTFFGGNERYNLTISKYSGEISIMQSTIKDKHLLSSVDVKELEKLKQSLNEAMEQVDALKKDRTVIELKMKALELKRSDIIKEKHATELKACRIQQLKDQLKQQKHKVDQLKRNTIGITKLENEYISEVQQKTAHIFTLQKRRKMILLEIQNAIANVKFFMMTAQIHKQENQEMVKLIKNESDALEDSTKLVKEIADKLEYSNKKLNLKINEAKQLSKGLHPTDSNFPYTVHFEKLPNDLEQLKEIVNEISARLDCMDNSDQDVHKEYEQRCADIEVLENSIRSTLAQEKQIEDEIQNIHSPWYQEIVRFIDTLNQKFSYFMKSMDYVGEIVLNKKEKFDFDSYGIQIMVQYRNNVGLQTLNRYVQSGGERAVAIAVYILSLQHLAHVPFRCVDEINQGMDSRNERKIFEMLVDETTQSGKSQYFFVTPKLLPNLKHNENMTVHIVYNGALLTPQKAFISR